MLGRSTKFLRNYRAFGCLSAPLFGRANYIKHLVAKSASQSAQKRLWADHGQIDIRTAQSTAKAQRVAVARAHVAGLKASDTRPKLLKLAGDVALARQCIDCGGWLSSSGAAHARGGELIQLGLDPIAHPIDTLLYFSDHLPKARYDDDSQYLFYSTGNSSA